MPTQTDVGPIVRQAVGEVFAPISCSSSGDNEIVPAVSGMQIRVVSFFLVVAGAVIITFKSNGAGALTGPMSFDANGKGMAPSWSPRGHFQTAVGEPCN